LSQTELARRTGIAQSTLSKLEAGSTTGVDFVTLEKLAKALGCDPGYLIVKKE
jgi:DNA-binding Xre family transcriptional regulator